MDALPATGAMMSWQNNFSSQTIRVHPWPRKTASKLGIGRALTRFQQLRALTLKGAIAKNWNRRRYLKRILYARLIPSVNGAIEVHMLLNHARIYEGLWSLYSFAYFCGQPCRIVVHDDGTLSDADTVALHTLFPGCQVISRSLADSVVLNYFQREGLSRCVQFRASWVYALKLFDPFFFSEEHCFTLIDSDILFFSHPAKLVDGCDLVKYDAHSPNLFSVDNGYRYSLAQAELAALLGKDCIERLNTGMLRVKNGVLDFRRIESYLQYPGFRAETGAWNYYIEQTLWAMELTLAGADALPDTYAICPNPTYHPDAVSGHYCGGGYWASLFYSWGLPRLASIFF